MAVKVLGIPVWPGNKTYAQIVAPIGNIVAELQEFEKNELRVADEEKAKALEAIEREQAARDNASLASRQAQRIQELLVV